MERRVHDWDKILAGYYASGLSVPAYAEKIGIHNSMIYHEMKKRREKLEFLPVQVSTDTEITESTLSKESVPRTDLKIQIGKAMVYYTPEVNPETFQQAIRLLLAVC